MNEESNELPKNLADKVPRSPVLSQGTEDLSQSLLRSKLEVPVSNFTGRNLSSSNCPYAHSSSFCFCSLCVYICISLCSEQQIQRDGNVQPLIRK